ncbi:MAG TPA: hypothetical protein VG328_17545, partial [Stellaceae bacterium]|nr:hypothetical protein [Stellaceae bacterium]
AGGVAVVYSGGTMSGGTLSGGEFDYQSGSIAGGQIDFTAAGGTLRIDSAGTFGGVISGFGIPGGIDLSTIAFGSSTTATWSQGTGSGTLTVTNGASTANLTLLGNYVTANFHVQTDGATGTLVTDPPVIASNQDLANPTHG